MMGSTEKLSYPNQLQAHSAKKSEIPDDSGKKSGTDWVLPKIIGSGRVSGTRQALMITMIQMVIFRTIGGNTPFLTFSTR